MSAPPTPIPTARCVLGAVLFAMFAAGATTCAVVAPAVATARTAGAPLPGWWRYDTAFMFSSNSKEKCIGPKDIDKVLEGPSNHHYDCDYPVREVGGGRARFEGTCTDKKHGQKVKVSLSGAYGPTSFALKGVVQAELGALSLPMSASISAERLSATCPAT